MVPGISLSEAAGLANRRFSILLKLFTPKAGRTLLDVAVVVVILASAFSS
jgi:hypothetical protein